jgi:hypothetical protein
MSVIEPWTIRKCPDCEYVGRAQSCTGTRNEPHGDVETDVVEVVPFAAYQGAVEALQRIATPGQGHARALWRITMAREWLEANGHPTTYGGQ